MSDGVLSQEEIDALLNSDALAAEVQDDDGTQVAGEPPGAGTDELNPTEKDAIGEMANIVMGAGATALSTLLGRKVEITTPVIEITDPDTFRLQYPLPYLLVNVEYVAGLMGTNVLVIRDNDACTMVDLLMGGDGQSPPPGLEEIHLSAISEAMNQMMGSASTALSQMLNDRVEISPPTVETVNFATDELKGSVGVPGQVLVKVSFRMTIEGLVDSEVMQLIPIDLAKSMVTNIMKDMDSSNTAEDGPNMDIPDLQGISDGIEPDMEIPAQVAAAAEPIPIHRQQQPAFQESQQVPQTPPRPAPVANSVPVQPVQFAPLTTSYQPKEIGNIDLIMDVPLQITVELGKTRKTIRDILNLGPGSVVELDKLAGEPVDLMVNGKLLAKGEVVVIDENFGIRITDIISPLERVTNLQ